MKQSWAPRGSKVLLAELLVIALVPLLIVSFVAMRFFSTTLKKHMQNKLMAISDSRQALLDARLDGMTEFISEKAAVPAEAAAFERLAEAFRKSGPRSEAYRALALERGDHLQKYLDAHDYLEDLLFVSQAGDIVFSRQHRTAVGHNIHDSALIGSAFSEMVELVGASLSPAYSDFSYYPPADRPALFVAAPVFGKGRLLGTMVAEIKPKVLLALARNYTGLPRTGEIVFAKRVGRESVYTTLFRIRPDASIAHHYRFSSKDSLPMAQALDGEAGVGFATDYRGVEVLARWQYIPRLCWGMIVKTDADELYAPLRHIRYAVWLACLLMALAIAGIMLRMSRAATPVSKAPAPTSRS